ncbi:hypothetical protein [Paenibacillus sp. DYY-L-2]|uniref:hypothetical protein n=1 Tax=Paenibacillus sp. DYY-L-2 TaxID=3447013 RepID=UPI003F4FFA1D
MEIWLRQMIQSLPEMWKGKVERQMHEGSLISFAGSGERGAGTPGEEGKSGKHKLVGGLLSDRAWRGTVCVPDPEGGSKWRVSLPQGLPAEALLKAALLNGAAFALADRRGRGSEQPTETIVLDYSCLDEAEIREGLRRIGEALSEFTARLED